MFDLSVEIQRIDRDMSRISSEREQMQKGLTENTTKTQETINKLAAQIAQLQASRQRLQDFMGFDAKLAELSALKTEHATCTTVINARTGERDVALADAAAKAAEITTLNGTIATRDASIIFLNGTVEARDLHIVTLNDQIAILDAQIQALLDQLPGDEFLAFDESRTGDNSALGFQDILVVYEEAMFPAGTPSSARATTAPDLAHLNTFFGNLKAANPGVNLVVLDLEAWPFATSSSATALVNTTSVEWYRLLVVAAKAHFARVALYGIPERFTLYLNYPVGSPTHVARKNAWFARMEAFQPVFDEVTDLCPTFYPVAPLHIAQNGVLVWNEPKIDLWLTDQATLCATHGPGKPVYPFFAVGNHPSINLPGTMPGEFCYGWLTKMHARFDGYVWWMGSDAEHPTTLNPIPDYWPNGIVKFHNEVGLS